MKLRVMKIGIASLSLFLFITVQNISFAQSKTDSKLVFSEVSNKIFPRQEKNLRKWDNPVVADLDQDGYQDLLLNDHGFGIQVCWNNKGKFTKPIDIIMGDLHGVSVGDINNDGNLEVIMSRGGGSGSNARNSKVFTVNKQREFISYPEFKEPLAFMRGRTVRFIDGDNDGDLDLLNFAFPDGAKKGASENYVYENDGKGELVLKSMLPAIKVDGQKTVVTDSNNDGVLDILLYGNGRVQAFLGNGDLTYKDATDKVLPYDILEATTINEIDFDNDGDLDLYITRGLEFEIGETFFNSETKTWGFFTKRSAFEFDNLEVGDVLEMENFQSQWPNNDTYFIGEASYDYEFPGETHSGKNIKLINSNALGFPDNPNYKDKTGFYIGYVGNDEWRIAGYLNAPATGVVHGVKSYPAYKHPKGLNDILLENVGGKYKDVTKKMHLYFEEHTTAAAVADFDNNGYTDILVIKRGDLVSENESIVYLNYGNEGFKELMHSQVISTELGAIGMAVEVIDYNEDGKVDVVIGNERGKWHLFKNLGDPTSTNNFITVKVGSSPKNETTALGALVELTSCGETQKLRVGSGGAQYSQSFNNLVHFGLGICTKPIKGKIIWSNGETEKFTSKSVNTIINVGK